MAWVEATCVAIAAWTATSTEATIAAAATTTVTGMGDDRARTESERGQPATAGARTGETGQPVGQPAGGERSGGLGYRYGQEMRAHPRYKDRRWEDAEGELQTGYGDWRQRQGGSSTSEDSAWDRLRADVRHAWDEERRS